LFILLAAAVIVPTVLVAFPAVASAATGSSIATLASANIGRKACSINSRGGKAFESSCTGNGGQPEYWCADFARWVWANSGVADTTWLDAAAGSFYIYGEDFGTLTATPAVGDVAVFDYAGGGVAQHVAIVTQANSDGTITTVSGDWNGQSGSEAHFASTSLVVANTPTYLGEVGTSPDVMGMRISAFVAPVGVSVVPVVGGTSVPGGTVLSAGHEVMSPSGVYALQMQSDGNLVESTGGRPLWSAGTGGHIGALAVIQRDGNLVVYSSSGQALWSSGTGGRSGTFALVLQDNGDLSVHGPTGTLWSRLPQAGVLTMGQELLTGQRLVSANALYELCMQSDGNLVEYTAGRPLWETITAGDSGDHALMQAGGDLVVYSSGGRVLWSSRTSGHPGAFSLVLLSAGPLFLYGPSGELLSNRA